MTGSVRLNQEQEEIEGVARTLLEARFPGDRVRELMRTANGFEQDEWEEIAALGWAAIALPEEETGAGYTVVERCLLLEQMGRVLFPGPYLSSAVLALDALALAADSELRGELLTGVAAGLTRATLVAGGDLLAGPDLAGEVSAREVGDGFQLHGRGGLTLDGASAELLLVAARLGDGDLGLFAVEAGASGVRREPAPLVDETRKLALTELDGAPGRRLDAGAETERALGAVLDRGAISLAAESVGGARRALDMTVAYMGEREQFGGPIGRFQALKHRLADLHVAVEGARESVYAAADAVAAGVEATPLAAAAAKSAAAECFLQATGEAIQLHGGIGFTEEHDVGLYYKRALVSAQLLGSPVVQQERIAAGLGV